MNKDTFDYMSVTIEGYYVKDFTREIKEALKVVETHGAEGRKYINKWKIMLDEKLGGRAITIKKSGAVK